MTLPRRTAIHWFRRSIRLDDNHALLAAVQDQDCVIPVFILDPAILTNASTGAARTRFLFESLVDLDEELRRRGGRLIVRNGKPVEELERLVHESGAQTLYFSRDYSPYSRDRDGAVTEAMQKIGVAVHAVADHLIVEPEAIRSQSGTPYTVFTPYKRVWITQPIDTPQAAPDRIVVPEGLHSEPLPRVPQQYGVAGGGEQQPIVRGGETEAHRRLDAFVGAETLHTYGEARDYPGQEGTSRLSAYLRMGVISPRRIVANVRKHRPQGATVGSALGGADTFLSELAWRDFYYQILYHFPHVAGHAFKKQFDALQWENNEALFAAWCEGRTGYPFIDAAQRQLNTEAWMHNRARMATASFLTKDLLIDWRWGERYFMQKLIDGDLASNNGGWQWAAGTGTDAQPYFRIFNPVSQGEKFDADGAYVRRWVPELSKLPLKYLHRPWELSRAEQEAVGCVIGRDYPAPIVDHKIQRERALALYNKVAHAK